MKLKRNASKFRKLNSRDHFKHTKLMEVICRVGGPTGKEFAKVSYNAVKFWDNLNLRAKELGIKKGLRKKRLKLVLFYIFYKEIIEQVPAKERASFIGLAEEDLKKVEDKLEIISDRLSNIL